MKRIGSSSSGIHKVATWVLGVGLCVTLLCALQSSAQAGQPSTGMTQAEYVRSLARAGADHAALPASASTADYVKWAREHHIEPQGGWQPDAPVTRDVLSQTLAQLYGVNGNQDAARSLESEGVVIPSGKQPTRTEVFKALDEFGFQSPTATKARDPGTPIHPALVTICHKGHTIRVASPAVQAHLAHGDSIGSCN